MESTLPAKNIPPTSEETHTTSDQDPIQKKIDKRQSKELVIAFSGALGSGIPSTITHFSSKIELAGYKVVPIKISDGIKDAFAAVKKNKNTTLPVNIRSINTNDLEGASRYEKLQDLGNYFRGKFEHNILAQYAIRQIAYHRIKEASVSQTKETDPTLLNIDPIDYAVNYFIPSKTVYLVDQLKHHSEVELLRDTYGDIFYLLGNICTYDERKRNLCSESMDDVTAASLMERDRKEDEKNGQQLEKTLQLSDYFIKNIQQNIASLNSQIDRFINIIHQTKVITPTKEEYGMYTAYSAALESACLSRQVGACIINKDEDVIATGCNDVPMFNGGLYRYTSEDDYRCFNKNGICYNDDYKQRKIKNNLEKILKNHGVNNPEEIVNEMYESTRLRDLIEFSRAIHAEMDAITSLARRGGNSTQGCVLFTTTFPCHNCARHIVASGITKVVFIEPYEKSLAIELHGDSISIENTSPNKVIFTHFVGVAPRRYQDFFLSNSDRKDSTGKAITNKEYTLKPKIHEFLDSYRNMETKITEHFNKSVLTE